MVGLCNPRRRYAQQKRTATVFQSQAPMTSWFTTQILRLNAKQICDNSRR